MDFIELDEHGRSALLYCPVSFLNDLDLCDFENYKHPPFMWTLWYVSLLGKVVFDKACELYDEYVGGGGDEGGKKDEPKKEEPKEEEPKEEEPKEEAPPPAEEEPPEEEAPPAADEEG